MTKHETHDEELNLTHDNVPNVGEHNGEDTLVFPNTTLGQIKVTEAEAETEESVEESAEAASAEGAAEAADATEEAADKGEENERKRLKYTLTLALYRQHMMTLIIDRDFLGQHLQQQQCHDSSEIQQMRRTKGKDKFASCRDLHLHKRSASTPVPDTVRMRWEFDKHMSKCTIAQL